MERVGRLASYPRAQKPLSYLVQTGNRRLVKGGFYVHYRRRGSGRIGGTGDQSVCVDLVATAQALNQFGHELHVMRGVDPDL